MYNYNYSVKSFIYALREKKLINFIIFIKRKIITSAFILRLDNLLSKYY